MEKYKRVDLEYLNKYVTVCQAADDAAYKEKHHILPRHAFKKYIDLNACPWNRVDLSYTNHCLAHYYFAMAVNTGKAWASVNAMVDLKCAYNKRNDIMLSENDVIMLSAAGAKAKAEYRGKKHHMYGQKRPSGEQHHRYGVKHTAEARRKMSVAGKGKHVSEETKRKISTAMKGNTSQRTASWWNEDKLELYNLWIASGKSKKATFSKYLKANTRHRMTSNQLNSLVKEFFNYGYIEPNTKPTGKQL